MSVLVRRVDSKSRVTLPQEFAGCLVTIERLGGQLRVRKVKQFVARRYSFKQLMSQVTQKNTHPEVSTRAPRGREAL